ncbi:hypothetical protein COCON_G00205880 [Conger conger]|uniref:Uncharacterized protein n=1 Tax=Conger conger TaxID=82655 RepID=A0A9Q1CZM0_CONCO|nr:hypothetical protein COCON_G00205880 [Conger conger]
MFSIFKLFLRVRKALAGARTRAQAARTDIADPHENNEASDLLTDCATLFIPKLSVRRTYRRGHLDLACLLTWPKKYPQ